MSPDEQEARSRRLSNDVIMLLPLSSGLTAVFNRGGDLCGILKLEGDKLWDIVLTTWRPPAQREAKPRPTLEELGL
jgi:hypothetical protein